MYLKTARRGNPDYLTLIAASSLSHHPFFAAPTLLLAGLEMPKVLKAGRGNSRMRFGGLMVSYRGVRGPDPALARDTSSVLEVV